MIVDLGDPLHAPQGFLGHLLVEVGADRASKHDSPFGSLKTPLTAHRVGAFVQGAKDFVIERGRDGLHGVIARGKRDAM